MKNFSAEYQKAFRNYLRYGMSIERQMKAAEHPTTHYIWRTTGDDKVRATHAANNGKIFTWNNPPATGHPGEDYGCRCVAEPYKPELYESAFQILISIVDEGLRRWYYDDFVRHFYLRNGQAVTLSYIGHFKEALQAVEFEHQIYHKVNEQIVQKARRYGVGDVPYSFSNSYDFKSVSYPHGNSVIRGFFMGNATQEKSYLLISGTMNYMFDDVFTDPVRFRDKVLGNTSDPRDVSERELLITDLGGTYYPIIQPWKTEVHIVAKIDPNDSIFRSSNDIG